MCCGDKRSALKVEKQTPASATTKRTTAPTPQRTQPSAPGARPITFVR